MNKKHIDKLLKDKNGYIVILQKPNLLLIIWLITIILNRFILKETQSLVSIVGFIAISIWAILEIFFGVNLIRRLLGLLVLSIALFSRL